MGVGSIDEDAGDERPPQVHAPSVPNGICKISDKLDEP